MASKRKAFLSRSVSLSLAALIVLTGAMFLITTLEQDHQEWKLVEDESLQFDSVYSSGEISSDDAPEQSYVFDEETSTYLVDVTGGDKKSSNLYQHVLFSFVDGFDYSKNYKFVVVSSLPLYSFSAVDVERTEIFSLRAVPLNDDGLYSSDIICLDQVMTDLSFKSYIDIVSKESANTAVFEAGSYEIQLYELQDDNAGSIAAAITGLTLIVMGVFATPMLNVFRRR